MRWLASACLFLFASLSSAIAQPSKPPDSPLPFTLKLIAPNVWAAIDTANGDAGANAGFVIGDSGVVVIDTFEKEAAAKALLSEIRKLTHQPIKFVVNTHYHLDHVAGNRVFAEAGAVIVAHRSVRTWINTENLKFFGKKITPEQQNFVRQLMPPDMVYDSGLTLFLGTREVQVKFFPGHTGGDSIVYVPDAGVVFCGDLFWRKTLPNLIDATVSSWIETLPSLAAIPSERVERASAPQSGIFVPGHGDVGTSADVLEFRDYLRNLKAMTQKQLDSGKTEAALVDAVMPELTKQYGTWEFFKDFSRSNILDMGAELQGTKVVPLPDKK